MSSPASRLKGRRRLLVVAVVILLIGLVWSFWPRQGDPRFVGTWAWTDAIVGGRSGELKLLPDGTAVGTYSNSIGQARTRWRVDGDRFLYGDGAWRGSNIVATFDSMILWLTGTTRYRVGAAYWQIEKVEQDRIEMTSGSLRWTLIRISR